MATDIPFEYLTGPVAALALSVFVGYKLWAAYQTGVTKMQTIQESMLERLLTSLSNNTVALGLLTDLHKSDRSEYERALKEVSRDLCSEYERALKEVSREIADRMRDRGQQ